MDERNDRQSGVMLCSTIARSLDLGCDINMKDHSQHPYIGLIGVCIFLIIGVKLTFWPHKEQEKILRYYEHNPKEQEVWFGWHFKRVQSPAYIYELRFIGIICLVAGLVALMAGVASILDL